jgi:hypothetical protein
MRRVRVDRGIASTPRGPGVLHRRNGHRYVSANQPFRWAHIAQELVRPQATRAQPASTTRRARPHTRPRHGPRLPASQPRPATSPAPDLPPLADRPRGRAATPPVPGIRDAEPTRQGLCSIERRTELRPTRKFLIGAVQARGQSISRDTTNSSEPIRRGDRVLARVAFCAALNTALDGARP